MRNSNLREESFFAASVFVRLNDGVAINQL